MQQNQVVWLKNPLGVLAENAAGGIVVSGNKIVELVEAGKSPSTDFDETFDCSRHVVLPGLINTHHHFYQTLSRARPEAMDKSLFPWLQALYPIWAKVVDRDSFRLATRLALTELMMSGCTTVSDHQYLFPDGIDDAMDIQAEEAARLGMRMTLNRGSMDLSVEDGGLPPVEVVQDRDSILADCERVIGKYHDPDEGAMLQVALAPCSPFSVTPELMQESAQLAEKHNCRLHTHLGETEDENAYCSEKLGCRPLEYLEEHGWLSSRVWLAHGIHFEDHEIRKLAEHGVGICHCPTSNMVLGSGQCRTLELEKAGVVLGLGVDGSASNDSSNLIESVRHALMASRLHYGAEAVSHRDCLRWASTGSSACLGRKDIGDISVGMQADLGLYTLEELRFSGAGDPIAALIHCGAHMADRVMIAGRWTVVDGNPLGVDVSELRTAHDAAAKKLVLNS